MQLCSGLSQPSDWVWAEFESAEDAVVAHIPCVARVAAPAIVAVAALKWLWGSHSRSHTRCVVYSVDQATKHISIYNTAAHLAIHSLGRQRWK